jgi:hypothetical protein
MTYQCGNPACATYFHRGGLKSLSMGYVACSPKCAHRIERILRTQAARRAGN